MMIPPLADALVLALDPVAARYRHFFAAIDWSVLPERDAERSWPGPKPNPPAAFLQALLVKIVEGKPSIAALRRLLVEHPALVRELGFRLVPDATQPCGFDVERSVPSERWLRWHQQHDAALVATLLAASVQVLRQHDPTLGQVVALDVTHHYAWVRQNNPNQTLSPRFRADHQPAGDPDCRLGGKTRHPVPNQRTTEAFWGYGSGIMATPCALGEVVLAVEVQAAAGQEIRFFAPLQTQTEAVLGHPPPQLTADAAFDAWRVYEWAVAAGGDAAIAHNPRGGQPERTVDGHPLCDQGHPMTPGGIGHHEDGYRVQHYACPLRHDPDASCPDSRFPTGGCRKRVNREAGGQYRLTLDRSNPKYRALFRQRPLVERVFSRLKHWGLERPCARRLSTVTTILLLGYLAINLTVLASATVSQPPLGGPMP
jgi:hypothetical protein